MDLFDPTLPRRVISVTNIAPDTYVIKVERRKTDIKAGHHVSVGLPGEETREYSLFSGENDEHLEILVRRVANGKISPRLTRLLPGDPIQVKAPRGKFLLSHIQEDDRVLLIATGTGIAPYRSFLRTHPQLDCTVVHGVRTLEENFGEPFAPRFRHIVCLSRPQAGLPSRTPQGAAVIQGRVTDWIKNAEVPRQTRAFLCGNEAMIQEATRLLLEKGLHPRRIHREKYF